MALRRAAAPHVHPAAGRFWKQMALVLAFSGVGTVVQAATALLDPRNVHRVPLVAAPFFAIPVVYAVWALLRIPTATQSIGQRVRLGLDSAIAVLGAAIFLWYVAFSPLFSLGSPDLVGVPVLVGVACLAGISAVVNIVLTGSDPVDSTALRLVGLGLLVGGVSAGTTTLIANESQRVPSQVFVPLICTISVFAAIRQHRAAGGEIRPRAQRRPHVSLLPYTAVVATDALLILATIGPAEDRRRYVVVGGAILITALVVVRQVVAMADNARLVARLQQQEDRLRHQATHDGLTQLANRVLFAERLDEAIAAGPGSDVTVFLIDLDDFKSVNDTLGHTIGDRLLAAVAGPIRGCVRTGDTVARLGGDEFAVLVRSVPESAADEIADAILVSLGKPFEIDGYELLVRASIGIATAQPGDTAETLLRNADIAMYAAKERGKGAHARYVPGMAVRILEHATLGAQLRQALDGNQLHVLYQPVVRLTDGRIIGMEALVRWRHPAQGLVSPSDFIPTAERTGLVVPLGRWVLHEACRQKALWREKFGDGSPSTIGVNVSGRQLQEPGFADEVAEAIESAGIEPGHLVLEVTETAVLTGGQALDTLAALYSAGVHLALDDFGTGQSSLGLIRTCPVHILKLDKSFVLDSCDGSRADQQLAIATAVVSIADALGLDAVAEGIESQRQADRLRAIGYRLGQGFHLARPLPPAEIDQLLALDSLPRA
jgi:diguanylate cyclase (GGDEF)-like protein